MPSVGLDFGHGIDTFPPSKGVYIDGKGYAEHDFNSRLGLAIEKQLKRQGIDVFKIQEAYQNDVPLITRTDYYNSENVDLVWSIHANYSGNPDANGICAFYWHDHEPSKKAAEFFVEELNREGFNTHGNGLHASRVGSWTNLHIVRETRMTAVLTENGFMSHPKEQKKIFFDESYIEKLSIVHCRAICRYFGLAYVPSISIQQEGDEEGMSRRLFEPSSSTMKKSAEYVMYRMELEGDLTPIWRQRSLQNNLTMEDALGVLFVAVERGFIHNEYSNKD